MLFPSLRPSIFSSPRELLRSSSRPSHPRRRPADAPRAAAAEAGAPVTDRAAAVRGADDGGAGGLWRRRRGGREGEQGEPGAVVRVRGAAGGAAAAGEPRRLLPAGTQRAGTVLPMTPADQSCCFPPPLWTRKKRSLFLGVLLLSLSGRFVLAAIAGREESSALPRARGGLMVASSPCPAAGSRQDNHSQLMLLSLSASSCRQTTALVSVLN